MNRRDFYFRQRVTEAELDETFDKVELADWAIVSEILGYGFLGAASASQHAPVPDLTVDLTALLAYDQLGRRLEIPSASAPYNVNCAVDEVGAPTAVVGALNEKWLSLFIEFDRTLSDPRTDGNGTTVYWKRDEWFKVNVVQAAEQPLGTNTKPVPRSDQLLLCDIRLIFGQTQILNGAWLSHSRRDDFTLTGFLHGGSHREFGTDPVPNATALDGGLMSAVDKGKLNSISWTGPGVAALLGRIGRAFQPANQTAPNATSIVGGTVNAAMAGKSSGGGAGANGICTSPPENYCHLFDSNGDSFEDPSGDKVYGRITYSAPNWTLSFYVYDEGVGETPFNMNPFLGQAIQWYCQEVYQLDSFPFADPMFAISSDQVAAEIPDATTSIKGKVLLAPNGGTTALTVVQANDSRLLPINALTVLRKLASKPSLIFYPDNIAYGTTYCLHQLHGLAKGDHQAVGGSPYEPADYYFEYDRSHADYPQKVVFSGGNPPLRGPGYADNCVHPNPAFVQDKWYYVYVIGRNPTIALTRRYALVFSLNAPWLGGPLIDDSIYPFFNGGAQNPGVTDQGLWRYWRFIGAVVNRWNGGWELVPLRKKGDHVEYELAQDVLTLPAPSAWAPYSLAARVPPTSLRAFLRVIAAAGNCEAITKVRPPSGGIMGLHDSGTDPVGSRPASLDHKLKALAIERNGGWVDVAEDTGWVDTNTVQQIDAACFLNYGPPDFIAAYVHVLGYQELDDSGAAEHSW